MDNTIRIMIEGDYALFTRPEMKVERVSYDVPTISALEGLIKSVYWKPAMRIVIDKIIVFNPIRFINIRRNECKSKISFANTKQQMNHTSNKSPVLFTCDDRSQRAAMLLRDVRYGVEFHIVTTGLRSEREDNAAAKHYEIMTRRLKNGMHFRHPCLGCSEFSVKRIELVSSFDYNAVSSELSGDIDLGFMLYKMGFKDHGIPVNKDWDNPVFSDKADPIYYRPHMINGVIDVHRYERGVTC